MKVPSNIESIIRESLRDWFKKEKWVRISSSGNIAGDCGTSKNKKKLYKKIEKKFTIKKNEINLPRTA